MLKVGITGGIGSGKSYVCDIFKRLGIPVFHADKVSQEIVEADSIVKKQIVDLFGPEIYLEGKLNRKAVSEAVFKEKELLEKINSIIHPAVFSQFKIWTNKYANRAYILKEAAIIFESGGEKYLDFVITVSAPEELRIARVIKRDMAERNNVLARIKNQWNDEQRLKKSDFVIVNDEKTLLLPQIIKIHKNLIEKSGNDFS